MNPFDNPWKMLRSRNVYENAWIKVREDDVVRPDGEPGIYGVVSPRNYAIGVVPLHDDGTVTLVGQFRYTLNEYSWEIPEGGCPFDEAPEGAARRELREETGLVAAQLTPLGGEVHLSNSISDERGYLFLATGLTQGEAAPDGTEQILTRRVPLAEAVNMALSGEINDALSIIGLLLAQKTSHG
jgi:8-oxo-dGTP pyrophosphatase MutT (NUDIX family)